MRGWPANQFVVEAARRACFGALAVASLAQALVRPDTTLDNADIIMEIPGITTPHALPAGYRMHLQPAEAETLLPPAETADEWFRAGDLFVRRTTAAQPSNLVMSQLSQGSNIDWSTLNTLHPYVAAKT